MNEVWKDMPNFEEYYEISSEGRARSKDRMHITSKGKYTRYKRGKMLKPIVGCNGYIRYGLKLPNDDKVYKVLAHRAVALAFIPCDDKSLDVGHKDNNRGNNCVDNLYWTTKSDNMKKAVVDGNLNFNGIKESNSIKILAYNSSNIIEFNSIADCISHFNVTRNDISNALTKGSYIHGYKLRKINDNTDSICTDSDEIENSCIKSIKVTCINEDGAFHANSLSSAAKKLNRSTKSVASAYKNGTKCNGYYILDYTE